jgi:hypothetical protein
VWDEKTDDFRYTISGEIKIKGGWRMVAEKMTAMFKHDFIPTQLRMRFLRFTENDEYVNQLFNDVMDFRDDLERVYSVMVA